MSTRLKCIQSEPILELVLEQPGKKASLSAGLGACRMEFGDNVTSGRGVTF